jgi:predicted GIY-YIG superfamily endonuclease
MPRDPAAEGGNAEVTEKAGAERSGAKKASAKKTSAKKAGTKKKARRPPAPHHSVYVVYLRNPLGDGKAGYYVGMTGLTPEQRLANHLAGVKAARVVRKHGVRLVPSLYEHLNPMTYEDAVRMEVELAKSLDRRGFKVFGGH